MGQGNPDPGLGQGSPDPGLGQGSPDPGLGQDSGVGSPASGLGQALMCGGINFMVISLYLIRPCIRSLYLNILPVFH